ncbi:MAG: hypothetical protein Q4F06_08120 [Eubacteriales bacterium]|nr:hypothetical protein [Eubacteriales bacterium]
MPAGVYKTRKKDGSPYYRVSFTYKNKHITLGGFDDENVAASVYITAREIVSDSAKYYIDPDTHTSSYNNCNQNFPFNKFITLINFRDNDIYIKTPIYLCKNCFLYFLAPNNTLIFSTDDLFYYSNHTIMTRGGYYFVNDYGMQTSILSRYGIRNHSVKGRDYIFKNNDEHDFRYENVLVINHFNGVTQIEKKGRTMYQSKIHINGDFIIGTYPTENEAAIAYNKVIDMLSGVVTTQYADNYIENISSISYASIYNNVKISKKLLNYIKERGQTP